MNATFVELKISLPTFGPEEGLNWISQLPGKGVKFSTSLGLEDQVITHWIAQKRLPIQIFTLDTGRLFQETYDLLDLTRKHYGIDIQTYFPERAAVEALLSKKGPNSFYDSVENRKECCYLRKVEPLKRALSGAAVWITGIRAGQSDNRNQMDMVEWDEKHQVIKYNPLLHWTKEQIQSYIDTNKIPVNTLHRKGFPSIGCAPCTRAVLADEDERAGRWWWEGSGKECGLHETRNILINEKRNLNIECPMPNDQLRSLERSTKLEI